MNAILRAKLYGAGITSPHMLREAIGHATERATPAPRITPSRRYRRWKAIAVRFGVLGLALAALVVIW